MVDIRSLAGTLPATLQEMTGFPGIPKLTAQADTDLTAAGHAHHACSAGCTSVSVASTPPNGARRRDRATGRTSRSLGTTILTVMVDLEAPVVGAQSAPNVVID